MCDGGVFGAKTRMRLTGVYFEGARLCLSQDVNFVYITALRLHRSQLVLERLFGEEEFACLGREHVLNERGVGPATECERCHVEQV
jgi:hypothetical protein